MLPNFLIIGAMKSGTSSLHAYLDKHPDISMSKPKELDFFVAERNWSKGFNWYESHFQQDTTIRGESSPNYSRCHLYTGVPERIYDMNPDIKLVYILRDPIERLLSHHTQARLMGKEGRDLDEVLRDLEGNDYVLGSCYAYQLLKYYDVFPKNQILILTFEELVGNRKSTIGKVFRFLGVDDRPLGRELSVVYNRSMDKSPRNAFGLVMQRLPFKGKLKKYLPESIVTTYSRLTSKKPKARSQITFSEEYWRSVIKLLSNDIQKLKEITGREFQEWPIRRMM